MTGKRLAAIAIAVVAAIVAWFVIENLGNVELMTPTMQGRPSMEISAVPIALSVIVATLIGWGAMSLIERRAQNPRRTWTTLAVIGALLLLGAPFAGEGLDTTQRILLAVLHVVVAAVFIPLFAQTAQSRP